ncbi:hypothetical protein GA0070622_0877 [Micromonospora sediminicola]|uniref:Uncharacterized protein n=1 Tax=Micromonospora sediminicola TaxID=946078 RepID=A0A1A9B4F8_9ACTN|nr:hypothetical protein [Micromonospora sediminicola]SBT63909.1 hypothetical protein GA0070622_0877 [Micromonospora sediminicola]
MAPTHHVCGYVPPDSPLRALAGRIITLPARGLQQLAQRVRELRAAGARPFVLAVPRRVNWTRIAVAVTAGVLAELVAALAAILTGHTMAAWAAAAAMVLLGLSLFPVLTHLEAEGNT